MSSSSTDNLNLWLDGLTNHTSSAAHEIVSDSETIVMESDKKLILNHDLTIDCVMEVKGSIWVMDANEIKFGLDGSLKIMSGGKIYFAGTATAGPKMTLSGGNVYAVGVDDDWTLGDIGGDVEKFESIPSASGGLVTLEAGKKYMVDSGTSASGVTFAENMLIKPGAELWMSALHNSFVVDTNKYIDVFGKFMCHYGTVAVHDAVMLFDGCGHNFTPSSTQGGNLAQMVSHEVSTLMEVDTDRTCVVMDAETHERSPTLLIKEDAHLKLHNALEISGAVTVNGKLTVMKENGSDATFEMKVDSIVMGEEARIYNYGTVTATTPLSVSSAWTSNERAFNIDGATMTNGLKVIKLDASDTPLSDDDDGWIICPDQSEVTGSTNMQLNKALYVESECFNMFKGHSSSKMTVTMEVTAEAGIDGVTPGSIVFAKNTKMNMWGKLVFEDAAALSGGLVLMGGSKLQTLGQLTIENKASLTVNPSAELFYTDIKVVSGGTITRYLGHVATQAAFTIEGGATNNLDLPFPAECAECVAEEECGDCTEAEQSSVMDTAEAWMWQNWKPVAMVSGAAAASYIFLKKTRFFKK